MTVKLKVSNIEKARAAWGTDMPPWVQELAMACDRENQPAIAQKLRVVTSVVSQTLSKTYRGGRYDRMEERVMGALLGKTVSCPVLGDDLAREVCIAKQSLPFAATNPERVQLYRRCPSCPNYRGLRKAASSSSTSEVAQ